jgi:hypothetical protein
VEGKVVSVRRVGLGLVHESAALRFEFQRIVPPQGPPIEIRGQVNAIDNARESVKDGTLHGVLSTETPQGRISSRLKDLPSWHLYPDPGLLGFKLLFPIFPEPEIYLPPGTDLEVGLKEAVELPSGLAPVDPIPSLESAEAQLVGETFNQLPSRTLDKKAHAADLIDVAFLGSREQLDQAFQAAGWKPSDAVSRRAVMRQFHAFLEQTNYPNAPMSPQSFEGRQPDLTLEKTLDSYEKRDHVRIWGLGQTANGTPVWGSAAVRETGATLSLTHKGFIHHVAADLDQERQVILRDLQAADCVASAGLVARAGSAHSMINATGELLHTGGDIMVLRLKNCSVQGGDDSLPRFKPGSKFTRYLRKEILTVRGDLFRTNCVYAGYNLGAIAWKAFRQRSARRSEVEFFRAQEAGLKPGREHSDAL